ncbi:MAG: MBL fold metallo-hydrolase [Lachnospiraceae bacterium]|nr:MBL fold metallo-hydrolase [Lachnospiraceae bacterium]
MKITYLAHSCFIVEENGYRVIFDPYKPGSVPGCGPIHETANMVIASHGHSDHGAVDQVKVVEGGKCPFAITTIKSYHDDKLGLLRGKNKITVLRGQMSLAHMGDIGCKLKDSQLKELAGVDVLLIPVGGHFTINAAEAKALADKIEARVVIPMHYRGDGFGYDVIGPVTEFTKLCTDVRYYGDEIEVTPKTERQTAVLKCRLHEI